MCFIYILVAQIQKEANTVKETKDKQIEELKKMSEQSQMSKQNEYEKKVGAFIGAFNSVIEKLQFLQHLRSCCHGLTARS